MELIAKGFGIIALAALTGCVTTPNKPEFKASEVIERQPGVEETPKWVISDETMTEVGGNVLFRADLSMSGNARTEACFKGAELDARAGILRHIKESLTASGQLNETDASSDPSVESLVGYLSQGSLSAVKTTHKYWEKIEQSDADSGERVLKLHCSVQVSIRKADLQKQLQAALGNGGNAKLREALHDQQLKFLEAAGTADAAAAH